MKKLLISALVAAMVIAFAACNREPNANHQTSGITLTDRGYTQHFEAFDITGCLTTLQTNSAYQETGHVNCDSVMIYSTSDSIVKSWTEHEELFHIDMMIAINRADNEWAEAHPESIQTTSDGSRLRHDAGSSYYMVPTQDFIEYLWEDVEWSLVTYHPGTIAFEEPEMWNSSGYSQGFQDEWLAYFGEEWQDPSSSPEALVKSMELKTYLFERIISVLSDRIQAVAPETNLYIATHSTVNYNAWNITAGLNHYMATGKVDGVIGQTWSDTIRTAYPYRGRGTVDEFLNAYVDFASYTDSVEDASFYALADPMCDSTSYTEEQNQSAYLQTIVASLLRPEIHRFEICPWLSRAFEQVSDSYRTVLQQCFNALNQVGGQEITLEAGTPGIYYAVSDTLSWLKNTSWAPATSQGFYGITMPLATAGIPIGIKSMEQIDTVEDLSDVKILIISYDNMLPMSETVNDVVAEWVRSGGTLLLLSGCNDFWEGESRFWNTGDNHDGSPVANLMKKLGLDVTIDRTEPTDTSWECVDSLHLSASDKRISNNVREFTITYSGNVEQLLSIDGKTLGFEAEAGNGHLIAVGLPSTYYSSGDGCDLLLALTEYATSCTDVKYVETNLMTTRRGNIVAAHALLRDDELEGTYIDIFDEHLTVVTNPIVERKNSRLLYATDQLDLSVPRFAFSGGELVEGSLTETADQTVFTYTSASGSTVSTRILAPEGRYPVSAVATCNSKNVAVMLHWNHTTSSLLLQTQGNANPTEIVVTWSDVPVADGWNFYYAEESVAVREGGDDEKYLIVNTAAANSLLRFCDGDRELIYRFDISEQPGAIYTFTLTQNYVAEVSADGKNWTLVADYSRGGTVPHLTTGGNPFLLTVLPEEYGCTDTFYFHLYNSDPTQGWGGSLSQIRWKYQISEEEAIARGLIQSGEADERTPEAAASAPDDRPYLVKTENGLNYYRRTVKTNSSNLDLDYYYEGNAGSNSGVRFCDLHNYAIYAFDLTGTSDFEIAMNISQNYLVEVSGDLNDWIEVADYSQDGTIPHIAGGSNATRLKLRAADYGLDGSLFYICIRNCYPDQGHGGAISQFTISYTRPVESTTH